MSFMRMQEFRSSSLDRRLRFRSPMVPSASRMTSAWQDTSSPGGLIGMPPGLEPIVAVRPERAKRAYVSGMGPGDLPDVGSRVEGRLLARNRPGAMSALQSLLGGKRTYRGHAP